MHWLEVGWITWVASDCITGLMPYFCSRNLNFMFVRIVWSGKSNYNCPNWILILYTCVHADFTKTWCCCSSVMISFFSSGMCRPSVWLKRYWNPSYLSLSSIVHVIWASKWCASCMYVCMYFSVQGFPWGSSSYKRHTSTCFIRKRKENDISQYGRYLFPQ